VRQALTTGADSVAEFDKTYYGSGVLNPYAALK
jgi:hypothetical protein